MGGKQPEQRLEFSAGAAETETKAERRRRQNRKNKKASRQRIKAREMCLTRDAQCSDPEE